MKGWKGFLRSIYFFLFIGFSQQAFSAAEVTVIRKPLLNIPAIVQKGQSFEILCQAGQRQEATS